MIIFRKSIQKNLPFSHETENAHDCHDVLNYVSSKRQCWLELDYFVLHDVIHDVMTFMSFSIVWAKLVLCQAALLFS